MKPEWAVVGRRVKIADPRHPWFQAKGTLVEIDMRIPLPARVMLDAGGHAYRSSPRGWSAAARIESLKPISGPLVHVPKPAVYCTAGHRMTGSHPSYMRQVALNQCPTLVEGRSHSHTRERRPCHRNFAQGYS